uniref:Ig-like domain-containing protein n=1 Tax=Oncorhynchus mykiss TaxID=8022 RepID=A0A8C7SLC2_ONCMY
MLIYFILCPLTILNILQHPPNLLSKAGESRTLECAHDDAEFYRMFWYKQNTNGNMELVAYSMGTSVADVEPIFDKANYIMIRNEQLKSSLVKILHCFLHADPNIKVTEPTVKVLAPSAKECEDRNKKKKKTLVCVATRFYPDHVTVFWQVNNVNRTEGAGTDNRALWDKDGLYSITSRLRVPANEWHKPENRFTCIVSFYDGTDNIRVNDTISGDLQGNKTMNTSTQTAKLAYSIFIAKSTFYGLVVMVMIWKFQVSSLQM